ncbi:hypothetical protein [Pseudoalteromonas obscura]|uniref:hypothetical protein n=1 Tax=Pseudoalteromonas obscura TaxID=3048491 RepID=UPI0024DE9B68|nr:hypothetical protein [Pseudoalteromonas sp. P94(2023)]
MYCRVLSKFFDDEMFDDKPLSSTFRNTRRQFKQGDAQLNGVFTQNINRKHG